MQIFNSYLETQLLTIEQLKEKIVDSLNGYAEIIEDENLYEEDENECLIALKEKYNWKERAADLGVELILKEMNSEEKKAKNKKKSNKVIDIDKRDELKNKILNDYINLCPSVSISQFVMEWVSERSTSKLNSEMNYSVEYVKKILREGLGNGFIEGTRERGGGSKKVDEEVLKCFVCTILDFPEASDEERIFYLNHYGPCFEDNIRSKTVNRILNHYSIKTKVPCFSFKERSAFNSVVLRYAWCTVVKNIATKPNTLLIFLDEAAVIFGKNKTRERGFYSVVPFVNKPLNVKKKSILAAVIPGFGTLFKWFKRSVKGIQYATFINEVSFICRTRLCNRNPLIKCIQDNCPIHKTLDVIHQVDINRLNLFSIIAYSPQLNYLVENYFGQMKFCVLYDFPAVPNENVSHETINQHEILTYKLHIMQQWTEMTRIHYNAESTAHIYDTWISIFDMCIDGKPLSNEHIDQTSNIHVMALRQPILGRWRLGRWLPL